MGVRRAESPRISWPTPKKEMVRPNKQKHENKHPHQGTKVNSAGNYSTRKKSKDNRSKTGKEMEYSHNK